MAFLVMAASLVPAESWQQHMNLSDKVRMMSQYSSIVTQDAMPGVGDSHWGSVFCASRVVRGVDHYIMQTIPDQVYYVTQLGFHAVVVLQTWVPYQYRGATYFAVVCHPFKARYRHQTYLLRYVCVRSQSQWQRALRVASGLTRLQNRPEELRRRQQLAQSSVNLRAWWETCASDHTG